MLTTHQSTTPFTDAMSPTTSERSPQGTLTKRKHILNAKISISIVQFIAALLLTLTLVWHISTVTLVDHYEMPIWWQDDFKAELNNGRRKTMWVVVFFVVPVDCVHALLCLDWFWHLLHGSDDSSETIDIVPSTSMLPGRGGDEEKAASRIRQRGNVYKRSRNKHVCTVDSRLSSGNLPSSATLAISTASEVLYMYHPLLHRRLSSRTRNMLLSVLDLVMLVIITSQIMVYFLSLPQYLSHCYTANVAAAPNIVLGAGKKLLSVKDACISLNASILIAGGFSTFMAIVMGMLHIAALVARAVRHE